MRLDLIINRSVASSSISSVNRQDKVSSATLDFVYILHQCQLIYLLRLAMLAVWMCTSDIQLPSVGCQQGTFNCAILDSRIGGSGDPRRKWESERGRERERECVEKCCFCLQNNLKEVYILPLKKPG